MLICLHTAQRDLLRNCKLLSLIRVELPDLHIGRTNEPGLLRSWHVYQ